MTYSPNSPQTGDSLGSTRDVIRTNFQQIDVVNSVNHIAFNEANKGKHKFVQMPEQTSNPTTAADEGALFTKVGSDPAETDLYFRAEGDGNVYQMTRVNSSKLPTFAKNFNYEAPATTLGGWTFLPGGIILQYGTIAITGTTTTVNFPYTYTNIPYNIQLTVNIDDASENREITVRTTNLLVSSFQINRRNLDTGSKVFWTAIGV